MGVYSVVLSGAAAPILCVYVCVGMCKGVNRGLITKGNNGSSVGGYCQQMSSVEKRVQI